MTKTELINSPDYIVDNRVKIAGTNFDRRRKVTKSMKRRMIQMYESGKSISTICRHFGVSYDSVKRAVVPMYNEMEKARKRSIAKKYNLGLEYDPARAPERADYKRKLIMENKPIIIS